MFLVGAGQGRDPTGCLAWGQAPTGIRTGNQTQFSPCSRINNVQVLVKLNWLAMVPSHKKSYEKKKKPIHIVWRLSYQLLSLDNSSCFHVTDAFLMTSYGFYPFVNRKLLSVFHMTSPVFKRKKSLNIYVLTIFPMAGKRLLSPLHWVRMPERKEDCSRQIHPMP